MARYDQPGFVSPLPGVPDFDAHDSGMTAMGSPGSPATRPDTDPVSVIVTVPGASDVNSDSAVVSCNDTLTANQVAGLAREPISGAEHLGDSGAGKGSIWPPNSAHPNEMNSTPGGAGWASQAGGKLQGSESQVGG